MELSQLFDMMDHAKKVILAKWFTAYITYFPASTTPITSTSPTLPLYFGLQSLNFSVYSQSPSEWSSHTPGTVCMGGPGKIDWHMEIKDL